jgi:uncharacterized protein (DUF2267 family)
MRYQAFVERVAELAGGSRQEAERAARAVLLTLRERIGPKESGDMASQLPKELKDALQPGPVREEFDAEEFLLRVGRRAGVDREQALKLTRAVFVALREAVSEGELEDWQPYLSTDYVELAARPADAGGAPRTAPPGTQAHGEPVVRADQFVQRVADRAGLDEQRARRAVDAVLETFGERIAAGEAEDLAVQLPEEVAAPLLRPGGDAQPLSAEEFVRRVAEREGIPEAVAREHARAVLTTLRESVTVDEWRDTVAELPREYEDLL